MLGRTKEGEDVYEVLPIAQIIAKYFKSLQVFSINSTAMNLDEAKLDGISDNMWVIITAFKTLRGPAVPVL